MKGMTFIEKKLCNSIVIPIAKLHPFEGHPYKVLDNEEMEMLTESVQNEGVLSPLIVRPLEGTDGYEVISGHRRLHAAQKAGLSKVPALVYEISREEAAIMLVDSNLHREHILPSEKAFAYKLKMEAMKHQGRTSPQVGEKLVTAEKVGADGGDSKNQVLRYVRLTHLIPELLQLVDDGSIALTPAVELSYLPEKAQTYLLEEMRRNDCTPSLSQAIRLKKEYQAKTLTVPKLRSIMGEEKANQKERLKIPMERIRKFFPKSYTPNQIEEAVVKLCENNYRRRTEQERYGAADGNRSIEYPYPGYENRNPGRFHTYSRLRN